MEELQLSIRQYENKEAMLLLVMKAFAQKMRLLLKEKEKDFR